jgi:putative ABC transport system permease protein
MSLPVFDAFLQDIRYGLRGLRRSPGFAFTAVLTLALGIGATTAIFSAVYALLIHPLPYHDPDRLVWITEQQRSGIGGAIAEPDMVSWRERGRPFEAVAGYAFNEYTLTATADSVRLQGALVSANFLSLLGVAPQIGRDLSPADDRPGSPPVALLSDTLWRERFSADPRVVGTTLNLDKTAYTIVGVLPPGFRFPEMANAPQVLLALRSSGSSAFPVEGPSAMLQVIARIRPRDSLASIQADLQSFQRARLSVYPAPFAHAAEGRKLEVVPLQRHLAGDSRKPLIVLLMAVGFVLLIACANVANLQLVRAAARRHEIALRAALGATRMRLARQSLIESMLLSALAACVGLEIGDLAIDAIRRWRSPALPWLASVGLDPYVFGFTLIVAVVTAVLFGAAPAIIGSRANLIDAMKISTLSGRRHQGPLRNGLLAGEVAMALVLLIASGLLVRSFLDIMRIDPGYDAHNVLTASVQLPLEEFTGPAGVSNDYRPILAFASQALPELRALPSVRYAALAQRLPIQQNHSSLTLAWLGPALPPRGTWLKLRTPLVGVTPDFFRAMGTPIVRGRTFNDGDDERSFGVAIVNRAFARQFFSGDALGKQFHSMASEHCATCAPGKPTGLLVVGIVADVHQQGVEHPAEPEIYVPFAQAPRANFHVVLATNGNPGALSAPLRSTIFAISHQAPVYDIATLEQRLSESLAQRRLTMFLLSAFATLALLLAAVGVYGVISYAVVQRTQEIGIRVALGGTRRTVLRLVLAQQARLILLGSAVGLAPAFALSSVMSSLLYGVKAHDFTTFALSWIVLTIVAVLAGAAPTVRATRTDPCVALRNE